MSNDTGREAGARETPVQDLLRAIPKDQRLSWTDADGVKATHFCPIGTLAHKAATQIDALQSRIAALEAKLREVETECERLRGAMARMTLLAVELKAALIPARGEEG